MSGVGGADDGEHQIHEDLTDKSAYSPSHLQRLFYVRKRGWVGQKQIGEFLNELTSAFESKKLKMPESLSANMLNEVSYGELKYGKLLLQKVTSPADFRVPHVVTLLETLIKVPIIRELNLSGFPSFTVDKVAMTVLKVQRTCLKELTPAMLPEEKRAVIRRSKTRREMSVRNMPGPSISSKKNFQKSKYTLEKNDSAHQMHTNGNFEEIKIKRTPWPLKSDDNTIYVLQRILFHVTPKIAALKETTSKREQRSSVKSTRRLSRSVSKIAIEMFGDICVKINEISSEIEIGNEEWEACRLFREYDLDKSGYIDRKEISIALGAMGIASTDEETRAVALSLDKDGDSKISEEEFIKALSLKMQKHFNHSRVKHKFNQLLPQTRFLLHPNSKIMQYWDMGLLLILVFLAFSVPVECAFLEPDDKHVLFTVNRVIDVFLFFDIVFHFFLMYPKKDHDSTWCTTWERNHKLIAWNYLSQWFLIDLISFIPYDVFLLNSNADRSDFTLLRWLRLFRLLRLVKLVKVIAHGRIIEKVKLYLELRHSYQMILWLVSVILFVIHFMACMWMMIVSVNAQNDTLYRTWYVQGNYGFEWPPSFQEMYPVCLYWAVQTVTTIGYGDAGNPTTYSERILATIAMLIGSILWAYLISMITTIIHFSQKTQLEHHQMMELLDQFVNEKGFDKELTVQLREYYGRRQALDRMESYQLIMNHLSPSLKGHVAKILTGPWLAKVSWLKNAGEAFITSVALLLRNAIYPPMETIDGTTFHVVVRGVAIKDMMVKCSGMLWGLDMVLDNASLRRLSPAIALTYCEVMVLSRNDFKKLLQSFPLERKKVRRASIWLAFRRKFLKHASEIELLSNQIQSLLQKDVSEQKFSIRKQFEKYDTEKDGSLTFTQLNQALLDLGFQATPSVLQNIVGRFDADNDGKVSLEEFFEFFSVASHKDKKRSGMHRQKSSLIGISKSAETIRVLDKNDETDPVMRDHTTHAAHLDHFTTHNKEAGGEHLSSHSVEALSKVIKNEMKTLERHLDVKIKAIQNDVLKLKQT